MYKILPVKNLYAIKILCVGKVGEEKKNEFIKSINVYDDIYVDMYSCIVNHIQLMSSKTQPILSGDVVYVRGFKRYLLYHILLMFEIEENVTSEHQFMNDDLYGSFKIKILVGDIEKEIKLKNKLQFISDSEMIEYMCNILKIDSLKELTNELLNETEKNKQNEYDKFTLKKHGIDKLQ